MEELIEQAKSELELIPLYASWKMWEDPRPTPQDDDFSHIYEVRQEVTFHSPYPAFSCAHPPTLHHTNAGDQAAGRQRGGGADGHGQASRQGCKGAGHWQAMT